MLDSGAPGEPVKCECLFHAFIGDALLDRDYVTLAL